MYSQSIMLCSVISFVKMIKMNFWLNGYKCNSILRLSNWKYIHCQWLFSHTFVWLFYCFVVKLGVQTMSRSTPEDFKVYWDSKTFSSLRSGPGDWLYNHSIPPTTTTTHRQTFFNRVTLKSLHFMGDNFFQKSLSFQLPLTRLQKFQYQILRVILEK